MPFLENSTINLIIFPYLVGVVGRNQEDVRLLSVEASDMRKDVYRAVFNLTNVTTLTYLFDIKNPYSMRLLSNKSIPLN